MTFDSFVIPVKMGIQSSIKDNLFPIFCVDCGREGETWCENCRRQFDVAGILFCPVCSLQADNGKTHSTCARANWHLDGLVSLVPYRDNSPLTRLIKQLKYHFVSDNADWMADILRIWLAFNSERVKFIFNNRIIVPVPLHRRRLRERGFNQAELIAEALRLVLSERGIEDNVSTKLERSRYTSAQARLHEEAREKNMLSAFKWPDQEVCPRAVVLVDDVYTTGATMNMAAGALKAVGAQSVWGFTLLRG